MKHARTAFKESWLILLTWCFFCAWVLYSCAQSYQTPDSDTPLITIGGLPAWVFWGIAVPWAVATGFTIFFALRWLKPEPDREETDV